MSLEYCYECDQPTGHAGELDDSLMIWGEPYCDRCYHDVMIELPGEVETLRTKVRALEAKINRAVNACSNCDYDGESGITYLVIDILEGD